MKLGLISSAWLGSDIGTAAGIRLTKEIGFDTIDIFADPTGIDAKERRLIREECQSVGLPVVSVPCCALGIADFNATVRSFHVDRAKHYLDFVFELRGKNLLLVLGEYIWNQEVIPPQDQWRWAVEGVRELGAHAAVLDLEIALEMEPFALSIVNSVARMKSFLDEVAAPTVRANLDVSHLVLAHDAASSIAQLSGRIAQLSGRIAHVHLSDCDGRKHGDLPPGRGCVPFLEYLQAVKDTGFDGSVSLELEYAPDPGEIVPWVREAYESADGLMRQLSIRN